jgi:hypothetical protein
MCKRRSTLDNISSRRVRDREPPLYILHNGFCQFVHGIHRVPAGGPRVPGLFWIVINVVRTRVSEPTVWVDVYAIHHLAVPEEAGALHQLGVLDSLIR